MLHLRKFLNNIYLLFLPLFGWSQIELPPLFSDHLVLQRNLPIPLWGTASSDAVLEVSINQNKTSTKADYFGNWKATLPPMKAGGPYELIIQSEGEIVRFINLYIGEVWLCSGQSNMEWALKDCANGPTEIPKANYPLIRFFHLKKKHNMYTAPFSEEQLEHWKLFYLLKK